MTETDAGAGRRRRAALGADLVLPGLGIAFSLYYLWTIWDLPWEAKASGLAISAILFVLIVILVVKTVVAVRQGSGSLELGSIAAWDAVQAQRLGLVATMIVFVALMPWLGFALSVFLLMMVEMLILGVRRLRPLLVVAFIVAAGGYILFIALADSRLPHGPVERLIDSVF